MRKAYRSNRPEENAALGLKISTGSTCIQGSSRSGSVMVISHLMILLKRMQRAALAVMDVDQPDSVIDLVGCLQLSGSGGRLISSAGRSPNVAMRLARVRFGSKAVICTAIRHVRFTPIATAKADTKGGGFNRSLQHLVILPPTFAHLAPLQHYTSGGIDAFPQIVEGLRQFLEHLYLLETAIAQPLQRNNIFG